MVGMVHLVVIEKRSSTFFRKKVHPQRKSWLRLYDEMQQRLENDTKLKYYIKTISMFILYSLTDNKC